jgi:hypothetical protein
MATGEPEAVDPGARDRFLARAALVILWLLLLLAIVARRPERPGAVRLPDRTFPPVTIDLNRDPWPRLLLIEGIGESLARRIVAAREERGGFAEFAEVQALPGVPDDAIERARPWLRLGPRVAAEGFLPPVGPPRPMGESRAGQ